MNRYRWDNDEVWRFVTTECDIESFIEPYVGNGKMGTRFSVLVAGTNQETPLSTLMKNVYDNGEQLILPMWNYLDLVVEGIHYDINCGMHKFKQILDIRSGLVSIKDSWQYKNNEKIEIQIDMLLPRTFDNCSTITLCVSNVNKPVSIRFGLVGRHVTDKLFMHFNYVDGNKVIGNYNTVVQNRQVSQGIQWNSSGLDIKGIHCTEGEAIVEAYSINESFNLEIFHSICSYEEHQDPMAGVIKELDIIGSIDKNVLQGDNLSLWKELWGRALAFECDNIALERMVLMQQFYLLCSLGTEPYPLGALGLSYPGWKGSQLWDADFWMFRAILLLWPEFAKSIVQFRVKTLAKAKQHAAENRYNGAWYPWKTTDAGKDQTHPHYKNELHLNIWIVLACWEYYQVSKDQEYLSQSLWPVIEGIADFFVSRVDRGEDFKFHLNGVLGPDEAVVESGNSECDDHFLTNYGVQRIMEIAIAVAKEIGKECKNIWDQVQRDIFLPLQDENGIIPEYRGYKGEGIKQADVILAFYPLNYHTSDQSILNNIDYYHHKIMDYGPLMNIQIESCLMMKLGKKKEGLEHLFDGYSRFTRGSHFIPFECTDNDNSIMLTGIGGLLQALIFGFYEASIYDSLSFPRLRDINLSNK